MCMSLSVIGFHDYIFIFTIASSNPVLSVISLDIICHKHEWHKCYDIFISVIAQLVHVKQYRIRAVQESLMEKVMEKFT